MFMSKLKKENYALSPKKFKKLKKNSQDHLIKGVFEKIYYENWV